MGQQVLMAKRYRHAWGVGRHLLGSQIFDYWRNPWGQKHEHYADGDLFDAAQPAGYHLMDRGGLYQWGPDLPDDFIDAETALASAEARAQRQGAGEAPGGTEEQHGGPGSPTATPNPQQLIPPRQRPAAVS